MAIYIVKKGYNISMHNKLIFKKKSGATVVPSVGEKTLKNMNIE
jgi:hypothetical protein